jgi:hypothetical protein
MSDHAIATAPRQPAARSPNGLQVAAIVAGASLALIALVLVLAGGALRWVDSRKDADGYLTTKTERLHTSAYALATDDLDVNGAGGLVDSDRYGKVRLRATSNDGKAVFVGIAPTEAVRRYLGDSAYSEVSDIDVDPFDATYRPHGGAARPAAPATRRMWVASAHGAGRQSLTWDVRHGNWSVVVMNEDGSKGVDAGVSAGADAPIIGTLSWAAFGGGAVLAVAAGGLLFAGIRRRREVSV